MNGFLQENKGMKENLEKYVFRVCQHLIHSPGLPGPPGLMTGDAGISMFLFHAARYFYDNEIQDHAVNRLERAIRQLHSGLNDLSFAGGIPGIAWTLAYLNDQGFIRPSNTTGLQAFDKIVFDILEKNIKNEEFDLLYGYTGTGLFFLERKEAPVRNDAINLILDHILNKAELSSVWPGMAHGLAGPAAFCAQCIDHGLEVEKSHEVLRKIIPEIFNIFSQNDKSPCSQKPNDCISDSYPDPYGWCHGIPGIGLAVYNAGRATLNENWMSWAMYCLKKHIPVLHQNEDEVNGNFLCHGRTGIANIYRKIYLKTNITIFLNASDYWIKKSMYDSGVQEILNACPADRFHFDFSLLTGIAGTGLTYLNILNDNLEEPGWDKCMLIA